LTPDVLQLWSIDRGPAEHRYTAQIVLMMWSALEEIATTIPTTPREARAVRIASETIAKLNALAAERSGK